MAIWPVNFLLILLICKSDQSAQNGERFEEELLLQPLANGDLMAHFNFVALSPLSKSRQHFDIMPRFVGELIDDHNLDEVDVALSRGVWRPKHWGLPPRTSATGAKVSAVFSKNIDNVDKSWSRLTNALAGQFCASLNFLDSTQSVSPKWSFRPSGISADNLSTIDISSRIRFGMLAGENVCTENLTPWKKLLTCGAKRGLATLLNAGHIHASKYHSIGLTMRLVCPQHNPECDQPLIEVSQYVVLVFDPATMPDNIRAASSSRESSWSHWSIRTLFGIGITSACPLAHKSTIMIDTTTKAFEVIPSGYGDIISTESGLSFEIFDVRKLLENGIHNLSVKYKKPTIYGLIPPPVIHANRYLVGHGTEKGGIVTKIFNEGSVPIKIVYLDIVPWFLRLYLHTLVISTSKGPIQVENERLAFTAGVDRKQPYCLEIILEIPAKSWLEISIGFEKSILKWLEYPPDANKGFHISSAVIATSISSDQGANNFTGIPRMASTLTETFTKSVDGLTVLFLYTESLLVTLPTPDFSMPYNVICLACTVVALAFGPLFHITTKKLQLVEVADDKESMIKKVKNSVMSIFKSKKVSASRHGSDDESKKDK